MKIIIPMSGIGKRFKDVGYSLPKPLIKVDGKPIIEHIVSLFPKDHTFIFICNKDHLSTTNMEEVLLSLVPDAIIIPIEKHDKGPVYATQLAYQYIHDEEDVLVSYCDYGMEFDIEEMVQKVEDGGFSGAVPSYTGFHPHLLHKNLYGGVLVDNKGAMLDYKEKFSFTSNPMDSHHSAGAYYFSKGKDFKHYSDELLHSDISLNGEKYTSMVYYLYLQDGKKVYVPEVKRFMQWGTPEDLEEFEWWSRYFARKYNKEKRETSIPQEREYLVKNLYNEGEEKYLQSHNYWEHYFKKMYES